MALIRSTFGHSSLRDVAVLLLFFLLPFDHKFSNIAIGLILGLSLVQIVQTRKISGVLIPWILPVLFLYFLMSQLIWGGVWQEFEKRLLLLFVPLTFGLTAHIYEKHLRTGIFSSFILGNILVLLICFLRAIIRSLSFENGSVDFNPKVIQDSEYDFLTSSVMGGNYFFEEQFSLYHHPMYFGLYIVFAQYLVFEVGKASDNRVPRIWLTGCYIFLTLGLFFLSSKAAIITSFLLAFYLFFRIQIPTQIRVISIVGLVMLAALFVSYSPKLKILIRDFNIGQFFHPDPQTQTSHGLRILSWNASLNIIKDNLLLGVGEGNKATALVSEYRQNGYAIPSKEQHNSHNQYLDMLIGGGLIGLGIFLAGLIALFVKSIKKRCSPLLVLLSIFCFMLLFENLLSRHTGLLLFSVFISYLGGKTKTIPCIGNQGPPSSKA